MSLVGSLPDFRYHTGFPVALPHTVQSVPMRGVTSGTHTLLSVGRKDTAMQRRQYIALVGAGALAGCQGDSSGGADGGASTPSPIPTPTPTRSPSPTGTPTADPTATPESPAPDIQFVHLVDEWAEFGDAQANAIDAAPAGTDIWIALRHVTPIHDGTYDATAQVEILNSADDRVAINQHSGEQLVEGDGPREWETSLGFTADWPAGEYRAEAIVRDNVTEKASTPVSGAFKLTQPKPKLEIISESRYSDQYNTGVRGVARNVADQPLAYAEVSAVFLDSDGAQVGDGLDNTSDLASGREWQFDCQFLAGDGFAAYELATDWRVA